MTMMPEPTTTALQTQQTLGPAERNLAYLAHELQTPLAGIRGLMALMADGGLGNLNPRQRMVVDLVRRNVAHLECLSSEFLDFAALETGTLKLRPRLVRVAGAVEEVVSLLRPDGAARGVYLEARVRPAEAEACLDPTRFREILFNLLGNAVRHSPDGGRIDVAVTVDDTGLCLVVGDQGAGIDATVRGRLFQPFEGQRADGHGLGLAVVQGIVQAQGGQITIYEGSPGTVFRVYLPEMAQSAGTPVASSTQAP